MLYSSKLPVAHTAELYYSHDLTTPIFDIREYLFIKQGLQKISFVLEQAFSPIDERWSTYIESLDSLFDSASRIEKITFHLLANPKHIGLNRRAVYPFIYIGDNRNHRLEITGQQGEKKPFSWETTFHGAKIFPETGEFCIEQRSVETVEALSTYL
jgi:hypothetical protein